MAEESLKEETAQLLIDKAAVVAKALIESQRISAENASKAVADALREVFGEHEESKRFIDITRIPLICQSIVGISARLDGIDDTFRWGSRIVIGAILVAILSLVLK